MWTVGLTRTGNLIGLDAEEWANLPEPEQQARLRSAETRLLDAGAHFVARDLAACDGILHKIEQRL
jgi:phosphonoacetaldehyde hydrolase